MHVAGEDRARNLRIMGPTRCQLRYSHVSAETIMAKDDARVCIQDVSI
jgi:hypothetical protein